MSGAVPRPVAEMREVVLRALDRLSPRQRQYAMLSAILVVGIGLLWLVLASNGNAEKSPRQTTGTPSAVTNIGVMSPGHGWSGGTTQAVAPITDTLHHQRDLPGV